MNQKYFFKIAFASLICWGNLLMAQTHQGFEIADLSTTVIVRADGSSTTTQKTVYKITDQTGITQLAIQEAPFFADSEKIRIVQAEIQNGDEILKSDLTHLETVHLPSLTFSDLVAIKVPFKNLKVGSLVTLQTEVTAAKVPLKGAFSVHSIYGSLPRLLEKNKFVGRKPFFKSVSDGKMILKIEERKAGPNFVVDVNQVKALATGGTDLAYFELSTFNSWDEFRNEIAPAFEKELIKSLPANLANEISAAEKLPTEPQKIQWVIEKVNQLLPATNALPSSSFDYYPRPIADILKTKTSDSKDFAQLTAYLLRKLNVRAEIIFANTTKDSKGLIQRNLPMVRAFNHVLILAGKPEVYVDSTLGKDALVKIKTLAAGWFAVNIDQKGAKPFLIEFK